MTMQSSSSPIPYPPFDPHHRSRAEIHAAQQLREDYAALYTELNAAKKDWQTAETAFDHLSDPKAVDVCIYRIRSAQSRYDSLLHQLRRVEHRIHNLSALHGKDGNADV